MKITIIIILILLYNCLLFWENFIYTRRNGQDPSQIHFLQETKDYCTSLENIINKKARKTCHILKEYSVF